MREILRYAQDDRKMQVPHWFRKVDGWVLYYKYTNIRGYCHSERSEESSIRMRIEKGDTNQRVPHW